MANDKKDESSQIKAIFEKASKPDDEPKGSATAAEPPPSTGARVRLSGISARAWEHPADRAAMATLRKVPGFDALLRKFIGLIGERRLRLLYLGSAVRVDETQFARLYGLYCECCEVLDIPKRPELFVAQTPIVNAGAVGTDEPFIVLNSGTLGLLSDDEVRFVLGHELGHIMSDHVLYKTMLRILLAFSLSRLGIPLGQLAVFALIAALKEWDRKSELSSDRAGLLCVQDPNVGYRVQMKMAGGGRTEEMNVAAFVKQAAEYDAGGDIRDAALKLLNLLGRTHPFPVVRLAELKRWVDAGEYTRILKGDYTRRDQEPDVKVYDELKEGAKSYQESAEQSQDPLLKLLSDMGSAIRGVFKRD